VKLWQQRQGATAAENALTGSHKKIDLLYVPSASVARLDISNNTKLIEIEIVDPGIDIDKHREQRNSTIDLSCS
jgi:hypothetical protein